MKCLNLVFIAAVLTPGVYIESATRNLCLCRRNQMQGAAYGIDMYFQEEL